MLDLSLIALPKQSFSTLINNVRYEVTLKASINFMVADITRDGVEIITGQRVVARAPIIPYKYLYADNGNFAFDTPNDDLPWWENFGTTHFLVFATAAELATIGM